MGMLVNQISAICPCRQGRGFPPLRPDGGVNIRAGMSARKSSTAKAAPDRRYWMYGRHAVMAALANPAREKHRLMATENAVRDLDAAHLEDLTVERLRSPKALERFVPRDAVHQGLALEVSPLVGTDLADILAALPEKGLIVALDRVTDPHNVGAILRSAAAFGAEAVVTTARHAPPESGPLAKAASGALDMVAYTPVVNLARALAEIGAAGLWRVGLDGAAPTLLSDALMARPTALVLGAEGAGLRRLTRENCDGLACLPVLPAMPSLNVSNAAAVALYAAAERLGRPTQP